MDATMIRSISLHSACLLVHGEGLRHRRTQRSHVPHLRLVGCLSVKAELLAVILYLSHLLSCLDTGYPGVSPAVAVVMLGPCSSLSQLCNSNLSLISE